MARATRRKTRATTTKTSENTAPATASSPAGVTLTGSVNPAAVDAKVSKATAASSAPAETSDIDAPRPVMAAAVVKKPELIDRVIARTGQKKKDVKPALEATLAAIGEALAEGEELNLPPLGKLSINREKDKPDAKIYVLKLRRSKKMDVPRPLADAAE